jgi:hypothetical protein
MIPLSPLQDLMSRHSASPGAERPGRVESLPLLPQGERDLLKQILAQMAVEDQRADEGPQVVLVLQEAFQEGGVLIHGNSARSFGLRGEI